VGIPLVTLNRTAFPDLRVTIEHQGTYQGEMQGMASTRKQITATGIVIDRYADGKIKVWNTGNALSMLQQVGAIPAPAEA
jgi:hypothetical protein